MAFGDDNDEEIAIKKQEKVVKVATHSWQEIVKTSRKNKEETRK